ncbi:hypothetical protein CUMW_225240 [Citrus unshiu]|uniref:Expansin n=1 Tax=Citrus unshiu TaxID=55188 RepID=A0A2H5QFI3_CITUN|nr:hypothetical protein CUMW_225240 [Citrus unshiu]
MTPNDVSLALSLSLVPSVKKIGIRFSIISYSYFGVALITNIAGEGEVLIVSIKGSKARWQAM